jgi:dTDP-4-dehydrorhamnose reductase
MRVAVVGAAGQLGRVTVARWTAPRWSGAHDVTALTRADVDLTAFTALERRLDETRPDLVINCAAYNDVEGAETDPVAALNVNALAVRTMARAASRAGAAFVHYGTDFVFDGLASTPYTEDAPARPQSSYGASKLLGEWLAADAARHYVLRVESLFGGQYVRSSIDRIIAGIEEGTDVRAFVDRVVTPSYVEDVAAATEHLVTQGAAPGLYHCVNSGVTTWFELANEIARLLGRRATIVPVKVADVQLKARRPQYAALSNEKLRAAGVDMPCWQDAVRRYLARRLAASG